MTQPFDDQIALSNEVNIDSLLKLIGDDLLERLSVDLGGARLYIPHTPRPHSPLAASIGIEAAGRICAAYGGATFDVPVDAGKKAKILMLHSQGLKNPRIAHKLGISRRTVQRTINAVDDGRQGKLFQD